MLFKITHIEFDFDGEDISPEQQNEYTLDAIGEVYEVLDEEELVDFVSDVHGWCIKEIDYYPISNASS